MGAINARKFFSGRVTLPGNTPLSFYAMMQLAPATATEAQWGFNPDGTFPSMDSSWGDGATVIPVSQPLFVGRQDVSVANGIPVAAGVPYGLQDYCPGIVDTGTIYCYSVNTQSVDVIFQGRQ